MLQSIATDTNHQPDLIYIWDLCDNYLVLGLFIQFDGKNYQQVHYSMVIGSILF